MDIFTGQDQQPPVYNLHTALLLMVNYTPRLSGGESRGAHTRHFSLQSSSRAVSDGGPTVHDDIMTRCVVSDMLTQLTQLTTVSLSARPALAGALSWVKARPRLSCWPQVCTATNSKHNTQYTENTATALSTVYLFRQIRTFFNGHLNGSIQTEQALRTRSCVLRIFSYS